MNKNNKNTNIYNYRMFNDKYYNNNACATYNIGLTSGNNVSISKNMVDLESNLRGQDNIISDCIESKHFPYKNANKYKLINNKICPKAEKWNISTSYDCENINIISSDSSKLAPKKVPSPFRGW
jgi:hypothetical protein